MSNGLSESNGLTFYLSDGDELEFSLCVPSYSNVDAYTGETVVCPDFVGRTLETAHKFLAEDIKVSPIQVENVSNLSGGITVYIGGIL